ncbi:MAG: PilC/PilY family type IV pilus protein [Gammaproteobacteria bacterium]|nr:PilC/PilY family type IV pilus protein [Gammaproteobacteria bacterium]
MRNKILSSAVAVAWGLMSSRAAIALPAQEPLFLVSQVSPMVMFAMSVDHQLFAKAFADYSDLNGDGVIDNTYVDTFDYFGYFDSRRCYQYDSSSGYFEPRNAASGSNLHHCNNAASDGDWSGNFLNWATMTRIDVLRKALYGGKRAVDSASQTVLQRTLLANDVHSFAKVFTPSLTDTTQNYTPYNVATMTLCNSTPDPNVGTIETQNMSTATYPPKVRIASGDWGRWASGERNQCEWYETNFRTNANRNAGTVPKNADNLFGANTNNAPNVKVEVCVSGKLEENCRSYNGTDSKPIGLLQEYGEDGTLRFGLVSGSYQKRDHGGVLRKAMGLFAGNASASDDEVNLTDGTFNGSVNGIVSTLDKVRLNTWDYDDTHYSDCDTFGIDINTYLTSTSGNRRCSNWGNPVSELYLESVRYLIGEGSATGTFDVASDSLGLPSATWDDPMISTEYCTPMNVVVISSGDNNFDTDDLGTVPTVLGNLTTATNAVGTEEVSQGTISSSVFIGEVGATPLANPDTNICSAKTFTSLSQMRGLCPTSPNKQGGYAMAGIAHQAHIGGSNGDLRNDRTDEQLINTYAIALSKTLPDFVIPLGNGSMTLVPISYAGPTNSTPAAGSPNWKSSSLAHLNIEEQEYDVNNNLVYLRFLAQWEDSAWGNDYDMDMVQRVSICVGAACTTRDDDGSGANDSNPGTSTARVTVRFMHAEGGVSMNLGFIVVGTTADGDYAGLIKNHGGGANFSSFDDDPGQDNKEPTPLVRTFTAGTSTARNLPLPLELAAKYGSFNDSDSPGDTGYNLPDKAVEWDEDGDGVADSFFFADDPSQIGPKLASYLATIATTSSSASVVANTVSLRTSTRIYQARFDSTDWSGSVVSFPVDTTTGALLPQEWDVATVVAGQDHDTGREWITWDPTANLGAGSGVPFRWSSLNTAQQTALDLNPGSGLSDSRGSDRLDWLRGDDSNELVNGGSFRDRSTPLGDVVNSTPTVVGAPAFGYPDSMETVAYSSFVAANDDVDCRDSGGNLRPLGSLEREPILYFGGNDGALHGVSACTGQERIAFVPNSVYANVVSGVPTPNLSKLTSTNYTHQYFVDGPSTVVDAFFSGAWHTVLVGTLRGGGSGVFALDVTDPGKFDETYANQLVLWDIEATPTVAGSDFEELGYSYSQPSIVKVDNLGWVAIFGNGYHGKSGKAILYVVRLSDGVLLQRIDLSDTGPGSGSHGSGNGLSTVAPVDTDGDGDADLVYGGDLNGNVWRFAKTSTGFTRASTTLLYSARNASNVPQRITSRMAVGFHPTSAIGRIVFFGTGKYYELVDQDPANAVQDNTMYGIWDRDDGNTITSVTTRNSNVLQQQTITSTQVATFGTNTETIRLVSNTAVQWAGFVSGVPETCAVNKSCGWYLDLTDSGEKMVAQPILRAGKLIFVTTLPSPVPCDEGGSGWLMELDPRTGGRLDVPVLDLNGDGKFDFNDMPSTTVNNVTTYTPVSGTKSKVGIIQAPAILAGVGGPSGGCKDCEGKYFSGSKQAQIDAKTENALSSGEGRKSWVRVK